MKKSIAVLLFLACIITSYGQVEVPQAVITNGLIKALLYLPDAKVGYYRGTRFDWSGIVASLEYSGHNFYGQWFEKYDPEVHESVMGPVEEFIPLGYDQAKTGDIFLKIGVGMLTKPDDKPYSNFRLYPIKNPGKWKMKSSADGMKYTHTLKDKDYSYTYVKQIKLTQGKPEMVISHSFKNTGKLPVETTVYNHNFPLIDKQPTGPGYVITFPFQLTCASQGFGEAISIQGNKLVYLREQKRGDRVYCGDLQGYSSKPEDYDIRIENTIAGAGIRVRCDRPIVKMVYWSSATTPCPEPYIKVSAKPGETITWELRYEYYTLGAGAVK